MQAYLDADPRLAPPTRSSAPSPSPAPIFQADAEWIERVKQTRHRLAGLCQQCRNRPVRVQTIDGHLYEGVVVGSDGCHLHLALHPDAAAARFFGPLAAGSILTLVLYELLVITLLA